MIDSAVLTSAGRLFHHSGAKTENSCDLAVRPLLALRDGGTSHCLESDPSCYREPVEVVKERRDHVGELRQVEHESYCRILDVLQRLDRRGRESSQD